jgi:YD repeat-containing protein
VAAGNGSDSCVANVQPALGEPPSAECPDSGRNRCSGFRTSPRPLFAERLCIVYVVDEDNIVKRFGFIGSVTTGFAGGSSIVRDAEGHLLGKTSETFHNTRDAQGRLISVNTADCGLLFGNDDE